MILKKSTNFSSKWNYGTDEFVFLYPFHSQGWPRHNFSLVSIQFQAAKQKNYKKYKLGNYHLIQHQILKTNFYS